MAHDFEIPSWAIVKIQGTSGSFATNHILFARIRVAIRTTRGVGIGLAAIAVKVRVSKFIRMVTRAGGALSDRWGSELACTAALIRIQDEMTMSGEGDGGVGVRYNNKDKNDILVPHARECKPVKNRQHPNHPFSNSSTTLSSGIFATFAPR
jgi:hypothetical protein